MKHIDIEKIQGFRQVYIGFAEYRCRYSANIICILLQYVWHKIDIVTPGSEPAGIYIYIYIFV